MYTLVCVKGRSGDGVDVRVAYKGGVRRGGRFSFFFEIMTKTQHFKRKEEGEI
jgi:hypothetical protein